MRFGRINITICDLFTHRVGDDIYFAQQDVTENIINQIPPPHILPKDINFHSGSVQTRERPETNII